MADWNAELYLKFADERTRAARDLLARVPLDAPQSVYDLGCGPGNSTALLIERYPDAHITGVDTSPDMLETARKAHPRYAFEEGDVTTWRPGRPADLLFANAVFQWIPEHPNVFKTLCQSLVPGGALAVQMPDNRDEPVHVLMREVAADKRWAAKLEGAARSTLPSVQFYYDILKPECRAVDIWKTIYFHPLDGAPAIVQWVKATGLKPFLDRLDPGEQAAFIDLYTERLAEAYPASVDGKSLLRFPRLFFVAIR
jgi:trans-aconitate 2-methyltransferase